MARATGLIEALGFGVRELPLPAYLDGVAFALVAAEHRSERSTFPGDGIPMFALTAGQDREAVRWRLAARAAQLRLGRDAYGVGAGPSHPDAVRAAICDALEQLPLPASWSLLTGWADAVRSPLHHSFDGELACYLFRGPGGVPVVGAVLRQDGPTREIRAVGCDSTIHGALRRAFDDIVAKTAADRWMEQVETFTVTGEVTLDRVEATSVEGFGSRVQASVRTVLHEDDRAIVQCRLAEADGAGSLGGGPGAPQGLPAELDLAGRMAPVDLSLGCDRERVRISRTFHENSKIRTAYRTLPPVDVDGLSPETWHALARPYRDYGRTKREHPLPATAGRDLLPLDDAVRRRRSAAPMSQEPIMFADVGRILSLSAGITGTVRTRSGAGLPVRATPTAGGLCSGDLFVLARRVDGLSPGIHYFHPGRNVLQLVSSDYVFEEVAAHTGYPKRVSEAAAIVLHVGAFRRNQWKYWERGYRMALLECGHMAQSVIVAASALQLVAHPIIAFVDDYFNRLVDLNGTDDAVLYLTLLGAGK